MIHRWNEARAVLEDLLELLPEERKVRLEELRKGDAELAGIVEELLAADTATPEEGSAADSTAGADEEARRSGTPMDRLGSADSERRAVGRFHLRHRLATGRFGSVWSAARSDGAFEQEVAIKLIDTAGAAAEAGVDPEAWLGRERHLLAMIDSPHVVRLIDAGEVDESTEWIAMELLDAEPMTVHADRRRLGVEARVKLVIEACKGVEACHRAGVLHLDVSPSNVAVTAGGDVKLLDLGSAKKLESEDHGPSSFTPAYAAPERFAEGEEGARPEVTTATDVWSLGALLYETLTGRVPVELADLPVAEARRRKLFEDPVSPGRLLRSLPASDLEDVATRRGAANGAALTRSLGGGLNAVALAALRSSPGARTNSAQELREDLERWLAGEPVHARRETFTQRITRFARRSPRLTLSGAAILLALVLGAAALGLAARKAERAAQAIAQLEAQEQEQLELARVTARRLMTDVYLVVARHAGTEDLTRRLIDMGIEVAESSDDPELNLWLADAFVKRGATSSDTVRWRPDLAEACLRDCARALELVQPMRVAHPGRYAAARVAWEAELVASAAHFHLCDVNAARDAVARSKSVIEAYAPPKNEGLLEVRWLYAQERIRFIESTIEAEHGALRTVLRNCTESLALFDRILELSPHLGADERSRLHRLRVMALTLRFLDEVKADIAEGEVVEDAALALLVEAQESAEIVLEIAEVHPTQELMLGRAAQVAMEMATWWRRLGRDEDAQALLSRALALVRAPGVSRAHGALVVLASLESAATAELPSIREEELGSEPAAYLYLQQAETVLEAGDPIEAARLASRALALLDTNASSCSDRAEHRKARGQLEAVQGRVEMLGSASAVGEARRRSLLRAEASFVAALEFLDGTGGDDLYEKSLAPLRADVDARLQACRSELGG